MVTVSPLLVDLPVDPQLFASTATNVVAGVTTGQNLQTHDATPQKDVAADDGGSDNKFICSICGAKRTRRYTIKQHFPGCVQKNGNPQGLKWTDHPSTKNYRTRKPSLWNKDRKNWRDFTVETMSQKNIGHKQGQKRISSLISEEPGLMMQRERSSQHGQTEFC